jgi:tape measure domain-containing protein
MAGRLSFSIAINLLTENFRKGSNQVKAAFRSMQMQILTFAAALGAGGIGLSNLVSRFIDVARETNRVTTALKNVSGGTAQFADNQRYLLDLAKKYGMEINALTASYAKFTAAASISDMSMMDQRKVFESVSRACTAFGMSADDSNGVMLALSQMMSKGKISSEELRLQMGERLPVALQAMAKAAGVSVADLDKLMKQGQLMSKDMLSKFAEALNEMIPNVDTDNLETSVNHLKNAFTELVNGADVQSKYKSLIDWLTNAIKSAADNIRSVVTYTVATISVLVTSRLVNNIIAAIAKAELAAKSAARRAAKDAGQKFDETTWNAQKMSASIKMAFSKAMLSIKATLISMAPTAILAVIGAIIAKFYNAYKESKRIKGLFDNYLNRMNHVSESNTEIVKVKALLSEYNKTNSSLNYKKQVLRQINGILGTELKVNQDVNKEISERIKLLASAAKAELAAKEIAESENESRKIGAKVYNGKTVQEMAPDWAMARGDLIKEEKFKAKHKVSMVDAMGFGNGLEDDLNAYIEYAKIIKDAKSRLKSEIAKTAVSTDKSNDNTDKNKQTPLQKAEEDYRNSLQKYKNQLDAGAITQEQFNQEIDKLNSDTVVKLGGILGKSANANETYAKALLGTLNPRITESVKAQTELNKVQEDYKKAANLAKAKLDKKLISEDEYRQALVEAAIAAANSAISIENIGDAADGFIKKMRGIVGDNLRIDIPKIGKRDTTFDYKKTDVDKKTEELDIWIKYKDDLREKFEEAKKAGSDTAKSLEIELNSAIANVDNLEDALKLAQVQEDIKNFNKELNESLYSGIKDIASSSDRVVSAFQNLNEVMNDVDASEWEKIMAIWNTLTTVVDSFLSIIKMIENITELTNRLSAAQKAESVVEQQVSNQKIINAAKEMAVDTTAAETKKSNSRGVVAANTAEAATAAGKSVAGIPFVGIAMAAAAVAGIIALFATLPKFAKGGIIGGGPSSGDKILARVNAGEMILNQGQQSNLFKAINSGKLGNANNSSLSSTVTTKVRAKDIILAINNELKSQGKKTIS